MIIKATENNATYLGKADIDTLAEKLTNVYGYNPETVVIKDFIESFGANIIVCDDENFCSGEDGSCIVKAKNDFTIYLPNSTGYLRDNFTLAHEFGHYILHSKDIIGKNNVENQSALSFSRYGSNRLEWEANWFAAGLLMPKTLFQSKLKEFNDIYLLADYFNVSTQAVSYRIRYIFG